MAQALHALIFPSAPNAIVERRMIDLAAVPDHKRAWWRPVVRVGDDAFDPLTQKKTGPVTTIEASQVVDTFTVSALSAQEISDAKDAAITSILSGSGYMPMLRILFNLNNRVRTLEGQPTLSVAQFLAAVKALL